MERAREKDMNKKKFLKIFEMAIESEDITEITVRMSVLVKNIDITFGRDKFNKMYECYKNNYYDDMRLKSFSIICIREIDFTIN
jgi:hypothetical protein